jgi:hypothetical protein
MARKIIDYRLEFTPTSGLGNIYFHEEGSSTPISLPNLHADVFCALAQILFHPNAYAERGKIIVINENGGNKLVENTDGFND